MIVLLDTSEALDVCAMELGCEVKQLVTPLTVDSIDGTGLSRYTHMREKIWAVHNQPNLF